MKIILAIALLALLPLAASAAVEIRDTGNVYVDGVNVGAPADAIANNPALASGIQTALVAFVAQTKATADAAIAAAQQSAADQVAAKEAEKQSAIAAAQQSAADQVAAKETEKQSAVTAVQEQLATVTADRDAKAQRVAALEAHLTELGTYIAGLRDTIAGLGGTSEAPPAAP